jgi:CheY-like chemotaxis protein
MKTVYNPLSNANGTLAAQNEIRSQKKLGATILHNAPEILTKLRAGHQLLARTEQEDSQRAELFEMQRQVRSLAVSAGLPGFGKIAQMANALQALLIELHAKPKNITASVIRTVAQAIDTLASLFDRDTRPSAGDLALPKILVVDDEIISRGIISRAMGQAHLAVVSMDDSIAAQRRLEREHFDLIFLDVEMPKQNGLQLCVKIREMAANRATPIVFVTAHSDFADRAQSALSGGNDFIAKPFLLVELAVKALTCLFKQSPPGTKPASSPASAERRVNHE